MRSLFVLVVSMRVWRSKAPFSCDQSSVNVAVGPFAAPAAPRRKVKRVISDRAYTFDRSDPKTGAAAGFLVSWGPIFLRRDFRSGLLKSTVSFNFFCLAIEQVKCIARERE